MSIKSKLTKGFVFRVEVPAVLLCCLHFLIFLDPSHIKICGGFHVCHNGKCRWQSSEGRTVRVSVEIEILLSPLTVASAPFNLNPHVSEWTLAPTTPVELGTSLSQTHACIHTNIISQSPSGFQSCSYYLEIVSVSVCRGYLLPGVKHRGQAPDLLWNVNVEQNRLKLKSVMICAARLIGQEFLISLGIN